MENERLNVLVFGAGAIGTYMGGSLALKGHGVTFVERPDVADFIRQNGMHITKEDATFSLQPFDDGQASSPGAGSSAFHLVPALDAALSHGPFDVALFALKSFDTPAFAAELSAINKQRITIHHLICFSNGVDNEPTLSDAIGPDRVIA